MRVTRKRGSNQPPTLYLYGQPLQEVDSLESSCHQINLDKVYSRKLTGLIYRRFYQHSGPESLLQMYLTLVRPRLEMQAKSGIHQKTVPNRFPLENAEIRFKSMFEAMEQLL